MKQARPDIEPTMSFLCTRVQAPDVGDKKKLKQLILFLQAMTVTEKRVIKLYLLTWVFTWVDAHTVFTAMLEVTRTGA